MSTLRIDPTIWDRLSDDEAGELLDKLMGGDPLDGEDDSEWEYEYDPNETEDFYLSVDVPPLPKEKDKDNVPYIFGPPERPKPRQPRFKRGRRIRRRRDPVTGVLQELSQSPEPDAAIDRSDSDADQDEQEQENSDSDGEMDVDEDEDDNQEDKLSHESDDANADEEEERSTEQHALAEVSVPKTLQILNLHTENPVISYDGRLLSCSWATGLGTDMFFAKRETLPGRERNPLKSFDHWDLLGMSSSRLVASNVTLQRKAVPPEIPAYAESSRSKQDRNGRNFIERLVDVKIRKGEMDPNSVIIKESSRQIVPPNRGRLPAERSMEITARTSDHGN